MAEETTRDFLARREHELKSRLAALRGQMVPLEVELAQVQQMSAMIPQPDPGPVLKKLADLVASQEAAAQANANTRAPVIPKVLGYELPDPTSIDLPPVENPYADRTIKDLAIQALIDGFPEGATAKELRNFILKGYHRVIGPDTLRTQLHRLKASGILGRDVATDTWNFRDGKRTLYARYDHPSSRQSMRELQDDDLPSSETTEGGDDGLLKANLDEGK